MISNRSTHRVRFKDDIFKLLVANEEVKNTLRLLNIFREAIDELNDFISVNNQFLSQNFSNFLLIF